MKFEFSPFIAFQVKNYDKALEFYEKVLGMKIVKKLDSETHFKCGPINFFVENSIGGHTFFEFKVDNLQEAKEKLLSEGCIITKTYSDKSMMFVDPYGMRFHIWQE